MATRSLLLALDFDGLLIDSYALLAATFRRFELDVGDERRFRNRRKFLKYFGGGRELLGNLANIALPKKKRIREELTAVYRTEGRIFPEFVPLLNACIESCDISVGIVSRNYTLAPGPTIRHVLAASGVQHAGLDFVIPLSVGAKKTRVLEGMRASDDQRAIFVGDEVSDYHAGVEAGYLTLVGAYGFDDVGRLCDRCGLAESGLYAEPAAVVERLWAECRDYTAPRFAISARPVRALSVPPAHLAQLSGHGAPVLSV